MAGKAPSPDRSPPLPPQAGPSGSEPESIKELAAKHMLTGLTQVAVPTLVSLFAAAPPPAAEPPPNSPATQMEKNWRLARTFTT